MRKKYPHSCLLRNFRILFLLTIVVFLIRCSSPAQEVVAGTVASPHPNDHFPVKAELRYAQNFNVTYHKNYKVVRTSATLGDWGAASTELEDVQDVMVLVQEGTTAPSLIGDLKGATVIPIPAISKIATNSAQLEIWMEMLGLSEQQVVIGGSKTYNDSLLTKLVEGEIGQVGYSWAEPPDMEVLLEKKPNIFFMVLSRIGFSSALPKLRSLAVPTVPVFDWAERDCLARAEWIKFCALFLNKEKVAEEWFRKIEGETERLKSLVEKTKSRPDCLWGNFVDGGFWLANANNAEARLLKDAGAVNPVEDFNLPFNPVGEPFTNEEWIEVGNSTEHWIISNGVMGVRLPSESYLENFDAWKANKLYHHYLRSKPEQDAYDWYNLGPVRPDLILADLVALLHPELLPKHEFVFFGNLEKQELI